MIAVQSIETGTFAPEVMHYRRVLQDHLLPKGKI